MGCSSKSWSDGYKNITKVTSFSFSNSPLLENDDQFIHVQPGEVEFYKALELTANKVEVL